MDAFDFGTGQRVGYVDVDIALVDVGVVTELTIGDDALVS